MEQPVDRSDPSVGAGDATDVRDLPVDPDVGPRSPTGLDVLAVISVGGVLGSLLRWLTEAAAPHPASAVAWATIAINAGGSFALGMLAVLVAARWPSHRYLRPFLGVGVLGGFTTFSTAMLDAHGLVAAHRYAAAVAYLLGSTLAGLLAAWLGSLTATALTRRRTTVAA